jgi:hypothetical protein
MGVMRPRIFRVLAVALGTALFPGGPLSAAESIGTFDDWNAFAEKNGSMCYIGSEPKKAEGKYTKRGDPFVLVTHRPKEKSLAVVSVVAGYVYKKGNEVKLTVDKKTFRLFTDGGHAWAYDSKSDKSLVAAMRGGKEMIVSGTSSRGTKTRDTYSLKGFTAALTAVNKACKVK